MKKLITILMMSVAIAHADENERALVDLATGEVLTYRQTKEPTQPNPARWVKVARNAPPAYDPLTHRLERVVTVAADKSAVTISWNAVALTQQEIDDRDAAQADDTDRETKRTNVGGAVATLRQWAADAAGTTVNNGNNTQVTQVLVNRLGIFFDRFADMIEAQRLDK